MKLDKKRRRQGKTNYRKRLILLKGETPRLVIRKTNKYLILQIIESEHAQDKVTSNVNTKDLLKYNWPKEKMGSLKSLSAAYLAGMLIAKKTKKEKAILDMGLIPNIKGSRVYACVAGFNDYGKKINYDKKIIPQEKRIKQSLGEETFNKIKQEIMKKRMRTRMKNEIWEKVKREKQDK